MARSSTPPRWHWIFLINLPIGIAALVYAWIVLPKDDVEPSETFDWLGMVLLSPGLAAFLYGVSSIPEARHRHGPPRCSSRPSSASLLIVAFVPWALARRNIHPLVELRLFKNKDMTVAVHRDDALRDRVLRRLACSSRSTSMQVRGEDALGAGLLLAPQGVGAMITMPIAGILADKIGPGKIVLAGITVITVGMAMFTQIGADTSYAYMLGALFIMGLGMGGTMMPIMTAALATLTDAQRRPRLDADQHHPAGRRVHRHRALLGAAHQRDQGQRLGPLPSWPPGRAGGPSEHLPRSQEQVRRPRSISSPPWWRQVRCDLADSFATVFIVATILVGCCLIPAAFLPRTKVAPVDPAAMMGH